MYPVLFEISGFPITAFGFFLLVAILVSLYLLWRLANVYDFDKEKILDVFIFTLIIGLIGSRAGFVLEHRDLFHPFLRVFSLNQFPGLSFWGAFWAGTVTLFAISKIQKLSLWQVADMVIVALFAGLAIGNLGCLLGGCQYGYPSFNFFAVKQLGLIDKRFPIQIFQSLADLTLAWIFWKSSLRFHFLGRIATLGLICLSLSLIFFSFFRADQQLFFSQFSINQISSLLLLIISIFMFYKLSRRSVMTDVKYLIGLPFEAKDRHRALLKLGRLWYKLRVDLELSAREWKRVFKRQINVKPTPKKF